MTRAGFITRLTDWLNGRFARPGVRFAPDTPLFADGLINSIRILEIIAWVEREIGRPIADIEIRMDHFRTVQRIADVFVMEREHVDA
jgi:acyl carrier protein